jgi:hypothetical protein
VLCCAVACCLQSAREIFCKMKGAGAPIDLYFYKHSGHAFMNALTAGGREKIKGVRRCPLCPCHTALPCRQ